MAVGKKQLQKNAVDARALADDAVDTGAIADDAIDNDKIAADAVEASQIKDGEVKAAEIATNAVDSDEIATGAVEGDELAAKAVSAAKIALTEGAIFRGATGGAAEELSKGTGNQIIAMDGGGGFPGYFSVGGDMTQSTGTFTAKAGLKTDLVTSGLMGTVAEFSFPFNVTVDTAQAAVFAKIEAGGSFANLEDSAGEVGYTGAFQLWPDTESENDAVYFGAAAPFGVLTFDVSATVATYGADSVEWEYRSGGSWSPLTIIYDETDTTAQDGLRPFQQDGQIIFSAPSDWSTETVDAQSAYWVRARIVAGFNVTQIPLLVDEHKLVTSPTATEMPASGLISRGRVSFVTASASNADTKIILCNLTKGTASAITTLTKALQVNEVADFSVTCDAGDQIAVYVTQEDGTTEFANGLMELLVVKS